MTEEQQQLPDDKPPVFSSWKGAYALVLGVLAALIVLFYLITIYYQ